MCHRERSDHQCGKELACFRFFVRRCGLGQQQWLDAGVHDHVHVVDVDYATGNSIVFLWWSSQKMELEHEISTIAAQWLYDYTKHERESRQQLQPSMNSIWVGRSSAFIRFIQGTENQNSVETYSLNVS